MVARRYLLAAVLGLCAAHMMPAQEPGRHDLDRGGQSATPAPVSANQQLADSIARTLKLSGQLHNYRLDLTCREGLVEVTGVVMDQGQHDEALRIIQGVPGVERVINRIQLDGTPVVQAQAPPPAAQGAAPAPLGPTLPLPGQLPEQPPAAAARRPTEPMPLFTAPPGGPADLNPPRMPPYAWPTYAPYNNFSRVAYPLAYPYNAWPFIGPCYPFPKVPLGWRSVKLEFEDGYWFFSKVANKHDWWRLKYW